MVNGPFAFKISLDAARLDKVILDFFLNCEAKNDHIQTGTLFVRRTVFPQTILGFSVFGYGF